MDLEEADEYFIQQIEKADDSPLPYFDKYLWSDRPDNFYEGRHVRILKKMPSGLLRNIEELVPSKLYVKSARLIEFLPTGAFEYKQESLVCVCMLLLSTDARL